MTCILTHFLVGNPLKATDIIPYLNKEACKKCVTNLMNSSSFTF